MAQADSAPRAPLPYRAAFFVGCALLLASCGAGLYLMVAGRGAVPGPGRLDAGAAAEAFEASGDLAAAVRELRMLIVIDPADCRSFEVLGELLARSGDLEGSLRTQLEHVAIHPYRAAAHTHLGMAFERLGRNAEAYGSYSMSVRLNPRDDVALASLGDIARRQGRLDDAVALYGRALPFSQDAVRLHNKLAIAHALAGRRDQAERHFDEALRLDPGFREARANRALLVGAASPVAEAR